jgi:uncharacterized protein (DUF983 family)
MIVDNGVDDKCPCCGEWTLRAFRHYGGRYNDGTEMDYCDGTCDEEIPASHAVDGRAKQKCRIAGCNVVTSNYDGLCGECRTQAVAA